MVKLPGIQLTQRKVIICVFVVLMLALGYRLYKFRKPGAVSQCAGSTINTVTQAKTATPNDSIRTIHPTNVVVEPWQGRHNIYAVFEVPVGFVPERSFMVMVDGNAYCGYIEPNGATFNAAIAANPNQPQPVVGKFRTRTALRLITKGQGSELKQTQNWWLVVKKKT